MNCVAVPQTNEKKKKKKGIVLWRMFLLKGPVSIAIRRRKVLFIHSFCLINFILSVAYEKTRIWFVVKVSCLSHENNNILTRVSPFTLTPTKIEFSHCFTHLHLFLCSFRWRSCRTRCLCLFQLVCCLNFARNIVVALNFQPLWLLLHSRHGKQCLLCVTVLGMRSTTLKSIIRFE